MFIRVANALLGLWLFASAFLASSSTVQFVNVLLVSLLVMAFGMASILGRHGARRVNAVLGAWLFVSALAFQTSMVQTFHNVVLAVLLVITSLFPHVHYQVERVVQNIIAAVAQFRVIRIPGTGAAGLRPLRPDSAQARHQ